MEKRKNSLLGRAMLVQLAVILISSLAIFPILPEKVTASFAFNIAYKLLCFLLPVLIYCHTSGCLPLNEANSKKINSPILQYLFALSACITLVNMVGFLTSVISNKASEAKFSSLSEAIQTFVLSVVMAALLEEILFRWAVFHACEGMSRIGKIVISATVFGLIHLSLSQFFYALAAGFVLAFFYSENKCLMFSVLVHGGSNLITWLFICLRSFSGLQTHILELICMSLFAAVAVVGAVICLTKRKKAPESDAECYIYISPELAVFAIFSAVLTVLF